MDALEIAILTVFIAIICCVIYLNSSIILYNYNIENGVFKCVKTVIERPGTSYVVMTYSPSIISVRFLPGSTFNVLCVGSMCMKFPQNVIIVLYVSTPLNSSEVKLLYVPKGIHVIRCTSYYNITATGLKDLYVIITLYRR